MTETPEDTALAKLRKIARQRNRLAEQEPRAILEALAAGARVTDVATAIGRTREHVRRVVVADREENSPTGPDSPAS